MQEFTFKYQNTKGGPFFILGFLAGPMLLLITSAFLLDSIPWIFWLTVPLTILVAIWCMMRFINISRSTDTITVDDQGFTSKDYGRVRYADIDCIPPYNALQAPPPSMRIRLKNGRKMAWLFNPQNAKSKVDIIAFTAFRELLLLKFMQMESAGQIPERPSASISPIIPMQQRRPIPAPEVSSLVDATPSTLTSTHHEEIITQLNQQKKRDHKYVTIPIAAIFGVMLFLKTCGMDFIKNKRAQEMQSLRTGVLSLESKYEENVANASVAIDHYTKKFGPVYLFTNDPEADLKYLPVISPSSGLLKEVVGLRRSEDNEKLETLIAHPDSAEYQMIVHHPGSPQFVSLKRDMLDDDSTGGVLYFSIYDPEHSLFDSTLTPDDPAFQPVQFSSSIPLPKSGMLQKKDLSNMNYASIRSILLLYPDAHFYMAAKAQDGITIEKFRVMKDFIAQDLSAHGASLDKINNFQVKTFNK